MKKGGEAYRPWDQEAGEEVEERVKECAEDGREYKVGSDGHHHHAIVCEHEQADACDVHVPEKLCRRPFKPKHGVGDARIQDCLQHHIWYLNQHLCPKFAY